MKQTEKTETKKNLTDAELQQATGGEIAPSMYTWNSKRMATKQAV